MVEPQSARGCRTAAIGLCAAALLALVAASAWSGEAPDQPAPDRVYHHDRLDFTRMLDVVCEAAFATVVALDASVIRTSLDPVTGTPIAGVDAPPADRREWIEARFEGGGNTAATDLFIEIRAADDDQQTVDPSGEATAVAVWVNARAARLGPGKPVGQPLAERFLEALDHSVARRARSSAQGVGRGPTPTPFIGPPLESTPLGPPELAPRTPVPGS